MKRDTRQSLMMLAAVVVGGLISAGTAQFVTYRQHRLTRHREIETRRLELRAELHSLHTAILFAHQRPAQAGAFMLRATALSRKKTGPEAEYAEYYKAEQAFWREKRLQYIVESYDIRRELFQVLGGILVAFEPTEEIKQLVGDLERSSHPPLLHRSAFGHVDKWADPAATYAVRDAISRDVRVCLGDLRRLLRAITLQLPEGEKRFTLPSRHEPPADIKLDEALQAWEAKTKKEGAPGEKDGGADADPGAADDDS